MNFKFGHYGTHTCARQIQNQGANWIKLVAPQHVSVFLPLHNHHLEGNNDGFS